MKVLYFETGRLLRTLANMPGNGRCGRRYDREGRPARLSRQGREQPVVEELGFDWVSVSSTIIRAHPDPSLRSPRHKSH